MYICYFSVEKLHSVYPELLKRLDDSSNEVRTAVTRTLIAFIRLFLYHTFKYRVLDKDFSSAFPADYSQDLFKAHSEALFKGLLIHLDDPSVEIQVSSGTVLHQLSLMLLLYNEGNIAQFMAYSICFLCITKIRIIIP